MSDHINAFIGGLLVGAIVALLGIALLFDDVRYEKEIIQHNCAEYDSKTGEFKWKDE